MESPSLRKLKAEADLKEAKAKQEKIKLSVVKQEYVPVAEVKDELTRLMMNVNVLPPIEAGASCFNENSATDSKELRRLTLSPQA